MNIWVKKSSYMEGSIIACHEIDVQLIYDVTFKTIYLQQNLSTLVSDPQPQP